MPDLPRLTDRKVKALVGERSYSLGLEYVADRALSHLRRAGRTLTACVQGTASKPYKVSVRFDSGGFSSADCACPVGSGACKHIAAVLIAFARTPDAFVPTDEVDRRLNALDKPQLVALLKQVFRREPAMENLLDAVPRGGAPLSPKPFRAQAVDAFDNAPDDWGYTGEIAARLRALLESGDEFLAADQPLNAAAVFCGVLQSLLDHDGVLSDDEPGHLYSIAQDCSVSLGKCLAQTDLPTARQSILRALFDLNLLDFEMGGTGLSDDAATILFDQTTPADRPHVAKWAREALKRAEGYAHDCLQRMLPEFDR
jgi:hypothetical protein